MTTARDDSAFLGLPMELLQRITALSSAETLTTLRLTCKTLEQATFDQFTARYFKERRCHILSTFGWTDLQHRLDKFPRLANRIKHMHFTTDLLPESYSAAFQLALAPEQRFPDIRDAQLDAYKSANKAAYEMSAQDVSIPDIVMMQQVMGQLQQLSPFVKTEVTLVARQRWQHEKSSMCHNMAFAIANSKINLDSLSLSHLCLAGLQEHFAEQGYDYKDLVRRTSSLTRFRFWRAHNRCEKNLPAVPDDQLIFVEEIIESAKGLECLEIDMGSMKVHVDSLLLARGPFALKELHLTGCTVSGHLLLNVFQRYKSILKSIMLAGICLHSTDNGWLAIFAAMLESLHLTYLFLCYMTDATPGGAFKQGAHQLSTLQVRHKT